MKQAFLSKSILFTPHLDKNRVLFVQIYTFYPTFGRKRQERDTEVPVPFVPQTKSVPLDCIFIDTNKNKLQKLLEI